MTKNGYVIQVKHQNSTLYFNEVNRMCLKLELATRYGNEAAARQAIGLGCSTGVVVEYDEVKLNNENDGL